MKNDRFFDETAQLQPNKRLKLERQQSTRLATTYIPQTKKHLNSLKVFGISQLLINICTYVNFIEMIQCRNQ